MMKRLFIDKDDRGIRYLCCAHAMTNFRLNLWVAMVRADDCLGKGRFQRLVARNQSHRIEVNRNDHLPTFFQHTGDLVQDEIVDWVTEHTSFPWSVDYEELDDPDETRYLVYSFENSADAVAFKLRWADWVRT